MPAVALRSYLHLQCILHLHSAMRDIEAIASMSLEASFMMLLLGAPTPRSRECCILQYKTGWRPQNPRFPTVSPRPVVPAPRGPGKSISGLKIPLGPAKSRPRALFLGSGGLQERSERLRRSILQPVVQMMRLQGQLGPILTSKRRPRDLKNQGIL